MVESKVIADLSKAASRIDQDEKSRELGIRILQEAGFMSFTIPREYGGEGRGIDDMLRMARKLSSACLATALLWTMHCQQVAVLTRYASTSLKGRVFPRIIEEQKLISSITTESGSGGQLMSSKVALEHYPGQVGVRRHCPIVSGPRLASGYLLTMRRSSSSPANDVVLVYVDANQARITNMQDLPMMGMQGMNNVSLDFEARVPLDQIVDTEEGFQPIAMNTMIPLGHLGWSSCWLGAAEEALKRIVKYYRQPRNRPSLSEAFLEKLARSQCSLALAEGLFCQAIEEFALRDYGVKAEKHRMSDEFHILLNNVKVGVSEQVFRSVALLLQLSGLQGYLRDTEVSIERTFRDLTSASLMYNNDRLLTATGKLLLLKQY
jgi:acyl-CoA dehydrogenase